jgi:hypothetical protein
MAMGVLGVVAAMVLILVPPQQAGAATTSAPTVTPTLTTSAPETLSTALTNAYKTCMAGGPTVEVAPFCQYVSVLMTGATQQPGPAPGSNNPDLSITFGFAYYFHLSHNDTASLGYAELLVGAGIALGAMCAALGFFPPAAIACGVVVALTAGVIGLVMLSASQKWDWYQNFYCDVAEAPTCAGSIDLGVGPFFHNYWYATQDVGATLAVAYWGQLIGWNYDCGGICP